MRQGEMMGCRLPMSIFTEGLLRYDVPWFGDG